MTGFSLAVQVAVASAVASLGLRDRYKSARFPALTLVVAVVLAGCLVVQLREPSVLPGVLRNADLVWAGQYYRLATAIWFQDGGVPGDLLNLMLFIPIGWIAEATMGRFAWCGAYMAGAAAGGLAALWWQPIGAGNSIATLGLAGCLLSRYLARAASPGTRAMSALSIGAAVVLTVVHDIHGVAILAGAAFGFAGFLVARPEN